MQQLLQVIPDTLKGRRDLAIVLTLVLTGRRRSEIINLTAADIAFDDSAAFYRYTGKGGLRGRRELPRPALTAIVRSLADVGKDLSFHAALRVALAGGRWPQRRLQRHVLQPLPGLSRRRPVSRSRASMSYATPPPSSAATSVSRSNRSASSSITARSPSPQPYLRQTRGSARCRLARSRACARRELARPAYGLLRPTRLVSVPAGRQRILVSRPSARRPAFWADRCLRC